MRFAPDVRRRVLLWSDRRCCLCGRASGADLDVVALRPGAAPDDVDAAIPLCPSCARTFADDGGSRMSLDEVRDRREQVYDECTRHLVPPVHFELTQSVRDGGTRTFPDVGFVLRHLGDALPVRVLVRVSAPEHGSDFRVDSPLYTGDRPWRLNPRATIEGRFDVPIGFRSPQAPLTLEVAVTIRDALDRDHALLPVGFTYVPHGNFWLAEP